MACTALWGALANPHTALKSIRVFLSQCFFLATNIPMARTTVSLLLLSLFPVQAQAYLDPGTGSIILQGVIAGIAVAWFTIKTYWYKLAALFGKKAPESLLEDDADDNTDAT